MKAPLQQFLEKVTTHMTLKSWGNFTFLLSINILQSAQMNCTSREGFAPVCYREIQWLISISTCQEKEKSFRVKRRVRPCENLQPSTRVRYPRDQFFSPSGACLHGRMATFLIGSHCCSHKLTLTAKRPDSTNTAFTQSNLHIWCSERKNICVN